MVVAINTRFLLEDGLEGIGYFTREVACLLAQNNPQHQFHFFFDRPFSPDFLFAANVTGHILRPAARHPLLWKLWFDVQVRRQLRKIKADVFFSPDGQCSLTTKVPQCLLVHDLAFEHYPQGFKTAHRLYYQVFTRQFIKKASAIITVSQFSKKDIVAQYKTPGEKITVVFNGVKDIFKPLPWEERDAVKDKYSGGSEFFLYSGAIHPRKNLVHLLKAFSIFKRRLQSTMKLVIAGRLAWKNNEFEVLLSTYKYKSEVVLTSYLPEVELAALTASAYAMVYPSFFEGFGVPVAEAMRCGVPVLTSRASAMEEVTQGAALYFNPSSVEEIADKLMMIYKDEGLRQSLVEKGKVVAGQYSWARTAGLVWESIEKAAATQASRRG